MVSSHPVAIKPHDSLNFTSAYTQQIPIQTNLNFDLPPLHEVYTLIRLNHMHLNDCWPKVMEFRRNWSRSYLLQLLLDLCCSCYNGPCHCTLHHFDTWIHCFHGQNLLTPGGIPTHVLHRHSGSGVRSPPPRASSVPLGPLQSVTKWNIFSRSTGTKGYVTVRHWKATTQNTLSAMPQGAQNYSI